MLAYMGTHLLLGKAQGCPLLLLLYDVSKVVFNTTPL